MALYIGIHPLCQIANTLKLMPKFLTVVRWDNGKWNIQQVSGRIFDKKALNTSWGGQMIDAKKADPEAGFPIFLLDLIGGGFVHKELNGVLQLFHADRFGQQFVHAALNAPLPRPLLGIGGKCEHRHRNSS